MTKTLKKSQYELIAEVIRKNYEVIDQNSWEAREATADIAYGLAKMFKSIQNMDRNNAFNSER